LREALFVVAHCVAVRAHFLLDGLNIQIVARRAGLIGSATSKVFNSVQQQ
jgi:hypothetical protein